MPELMISQLQTDVWEMDLFCLMRLVTFLFLFFYFYGPLPADSEIAARARLDEHRFACPRLKPRFGSGRDAAGSLSGLNYTPPDRSRLDVQLPALPPSLQEQPAAFHSFAFKILASLLGLVCWRGLDSPKVCTALDMDLPIYISIYIYDFFNGSSC